MTDRIRRKLISLFQYYGVFNPKDIADDVIQMLTNLTHQEYLDLREEMITQKD